MRAALVDDLSRIRPRADLPDVRIHDLSHSCASWPDFLPATWTAIAAASMHAEDDGSEDGAWH